MKVRVIKITSNEQWAEYENVVSIQFERAVFGMCFKVIREGKDACLWSIDDFRVEFIDIVE